MHLPTNHKARFRRSSESDGIGRHEGIALLSVLVVTTLATMVLLMFLSLANIEAVSSDQYAQGVRAQSLANSATNMVIGQIRSATQELGTVWVSQPGAMRTFDVSGEFSTGYKLFSDDKMVVHSVSELLDDLPEERWDTAEQLVHWVDMNAPVIRGEQIHYPIAHPGALESGVEGFAYEDGKVAKGSGELPMPVRWVYMLEDGTPGTLSEDFTFIAAPNYGGRKPSKNNPIVGRVAFWTDDESCKININTASEPTAWDVPRVGGEQDRKLGEFQPAKREFQRFPGHPAMTALSPVLMPQPDEPPSEQQLSPEQKKVIYDIVPRIAAGGSYSATRRVGQVLNDPKARIVLDRNRLLPSLDELAFRPGATGVKPKLDTRQVANLPDKDTLYATPGKVIPPDPKKTEKLLREARFFLTAHSRAPEVNVFGLPRVSMWPTSSEAENKLGKMRTPFDDLIRLCSTMGPQSDRHVYYFERADSRSATHDILEISRNLELYRYLQGLTSRKVPGYGGVLSDKWEEDRDQILTEVFDYIRCTNLHDDQLKPRTYSLKAHDKGIKTQFTEGRPSTAALNSWPGHGQVVPIEVPSSAVSTRGVGRFYTISEAGILMICCADAGAPKDMSDPAAGPQHPKGVMGSNVYGSKSERGYNWALPRELDWAAEKQERCLQAALLFELFCPAQGWTHLNEDITIEVEVINQFTVDGEPVKFHLDTDVWQSTGDAKIGGSRMGALGEASSSTMAGGTVGFWALADDRFAPEREPLLEDRNLEPKKSSERSDERRRVYPFISEPFIVNGNDETMTMGSGELEVRIRIGTGYSPDAVPMEERTIVQTLRLKFPEATLPVPILAQDQNGNYEVEGGPQKLDEGGYNYTLPKKTNKNGDPRQRRGGVFFPSYWWTLNRRGCGIGDPAHNHNNWAGWQNVEKPEDWEPGYEGEKYVPLAETFQGSHRGRFSKFGLPTWTLVNNNPSAKGRDVLRTLVPVHRDYRLIAALKDVPAGAFVPVDGYHNKKKYLAHHFSGITADVMAPWGYRRNTPGLVDAMEEDNPKEKEKRYYPLRKPDFPPVDGEDPDDPSPQLWGDFDNGVGVLTDGAYINKPDEGNRFSQKKKDKSGQDYFTIPYFDSPGRERSGTPAFFSPNRQVSSAGMFGSLPTGVLRNQPWQTLLFRPQPGHPGDALPAADAAGGKRGSKYPPDHVLLDLFWMPVVEPYAISEPFSTAGKINMNYQILPFTYLTRNTAMRAVLKSEHMLAIPINRGSTYKKGNGLPLKTQIRRWIDPEETLRQFQSRFDQGEVFRMASEICDVHLVPEHLTLEAMSEDFWERHALSGDNSRERPYANLYPRLTTQSNIYQVHVISQVIKKSRDSDPEKFDLEHDVPVAEYRGSSLIERYIDPGEPTLPDYATTADSTGTLSDHYRFRIISQERFAP